MLMHSITSCNNTGSDAQQQQQQNGNRDAVTVVPTTLATTTTQRTQDIDNRQGAQGNNNKVADNANDKTKNDDNHASGRARRMIRV